MPTRKQHQTRAVERLFGEKLLSLVALMGPGAIGQVHSPRSGTMFDPRGRALAPLAWAPYCCRTDPCIGPCSLAPHWPQRPGPSVLAPASWPQRPGPSVLAPASWPQRPGPSVLAPVSFAPVSLPCARGSGAPGTVSLAPCIDRSGMAGTPIDMSASFALEAGAISRDATCRPFGLGPGARFPCHCEELPWLP
jgi:hypothetical protein